MQALIDELERLVEGSLHVPVGGRVMVDEGALRRIMEDMRKSVPDEVRMGQRIAGERDRILAEARAQARRIIEEAQGQIMSRVDDQAIVQAARLRARDIQQEGERAAAALRAEADQYVLTQFNALESRLMRVLREVQAGQRALASGEKTETGARS